MIGTTSSGIWYELKYIYIPYVCAVGMLLHIQCKWKVQGQGLKQPTVLLWNFKVINIQDRMCLEKSLEF